MVINWPNRGPKYDLREGLPKGAKGTEAGMFCMLVPKGKHSRAWWGAAYVYEMWECPACEEVAARIFAPKVEYRTTHCPNCGYDEEDQDEQEKEPAYT